MCVAVAVVGSIAAGGAIASAKIQSNAAKNAAQTQTDAANKALGVQQQQYQQGRQDFQPYQQAGAASVGRLQQRAGQQVPQFAPGGPQPQWGSLGNPMGGASQGVSQAMASMGGQTAPAYAAQQGAPVGQGAMNGAGGMPQGQPGVGPVLGQQQAPKMVSLRAPDGSVQKFPESAVPQVLAAAQAKGHQLQVVG